MPGIGSHPANRVITRQTAVINAKKAACPKRQAALCIAFPLCFHDQKGGDIHGKNDDLEALKAKFEELGAAITLK